MSEDGARRNASSGCRITEACRIAVRFFSREEANLSVTQEAFELSVLKEP